MSLLQNSNAVTPSGGYDIDYSLRCDGGSDAHSTGGSTSYLHRSVSSGTGDSQRKFTG